MGMNSRLILDTEVGAGADVVAVVMIVAVATGVFVTGIVFVIVNGLVNKNKKIN